MDVSIQMREKKKYLKKKYLKKKKKRKRKKEGRKEDRGNGENVKIWDENGNEKEFEKKVKLKR